MLQGIKTLEFATMREAFSEKKSLIELGVGADFGIKSLEECQISCSPEITFFQDEKPFLKIKTACYFIVDPETWKAYRKPESHSICFPKGFTDHLLMISIGTLRGVLHAKTEGTEFNQFILPTINVTTLSKGDVEIEIA